MLRFRVLNLAASAALTAFNAALGIWPMVAVNAALCVIDAWFLVGMLRTRRLGSAFDWLPVEPGDALLARFLTLHGHDAAQFYPAAADLPAAIGTAGPDRTLCALVLHGDTTVGLVVALRVDPADGPATGTEHAGGSWQLVVDYVIPGYRDYTAGPMIYSPTGPFAARGATRVVAGPELTAVRTYLGRAGFADDAQGSVRELSPLPS